MRTNQEIQHDILLQRQQDNAVLLSSQFSFCVGGNMLTHSVTPEEYTEMVKHGLGSVVFGYSLVIEP